MSIKRVLLMVLSSLLFFPCGWSEADVVDDLLGLLKEKGIITQEQAQSLKEQAQIEKAMQKREIVEEVKAIYKPQEEMEAQFKSLEDVRKYAVLGKEKPKKINLGGYIQLQSVFSDNDEGGAHADGISLEDSFNIRRARLEVSGEVMEDVHFKLSGELDTSDNNLRDAYIKLTHLDYANLTVGQFKVPFALEELTSSTVIDTVERSEVVNQIGMERDIGVQIGANLFDERLEYAFGVFNGAGINVSKNDNDNFMWVGRAVWTAVKEHPLAGKDFTLKVGAKAAFSDDGSKNFDSELEVMEDIPIPGDSDGVDVDFVGERHLYGGELVALWGPWKLQAEYIKAELDPEGEQKIGFELDSSHAIVEDIDPAGFYVLGAYDIVPDKWQAVAKYEQFDPDIGDYDDQRMTLGINYFMKKHNHKVMFNYVRIDRDDADNEDDVVQNVFLTRYQIKF